MPGVSFYLTPQRLKRLDEYSYSAIDKSPLSNYVMRHWWVYSASFAPKWLAPNAITLIGFSAILINFATVSIWDQSLLGYDTPRWVYATCAFGLFFYQTMDNIDGKQARRTGTSSSLGELFDHGLDTLNCPIGGLIQASAMGLGQSPYALLCVLTPCWSMYLSTWEEFHTGTLYLGFVNGPVEGVLIAVGILIVSAIKGSGWWALPVSEVIGNLPLVGSNFQMLDFMMFFLFCSFLIAHLPLCLLNVYATLSPPRSRRPLTSPRLPPRRNPSTTPREAFSQLSPIVTFSFLTAMWVLSPKSRVLKDGYLEEFALIVCFLFGQLSSKIILAQLTRGPFPFSWSLFLIPLSIPAVLINLPYLGFPTLLPSTLEPLYLHLTLFISLASYAHATRQIITSFCRYLGIECLKIPYPNKACEGYETVPSATTRIAVGGEGEGEEEEGREELEFEMNRLDSSSSTTTTSPTKRSGGLRNDRGLLSVVGGVPSTFKGLLGSGEGRKRSNTSERERGEGGGGVDLVQGGRRLATVSTTSPVKNTSPTKKNTTSR